MAGILNNKERILDFIVTQEGKRQAGHGELRIRYATFTDLHTFYETSGSFVNPDLAADASDRIFFEAGNRYQDVVVPELEGGTIMRPLQTEDYQMSGRTIVSGSIRLATSGNQILSGSALGPGLTTVLEGITQNFADLRTIGTIDEFSTWQDIELSPVSGTFSVNNHTKYLRAGSDGQANIDDVPSVFNDRRFADFANFKYLPPVNIPLPGHTAGTLLGNYPRFNEKEILTLDELMASLKGKPLQQFSFSKTSRANNIVVQFFEQDLGGVEKLSVVDFGSFEDDEPLSRGKRVLFIGKIQLDSFGVETFMCLFTVVID
jgi:hypothetical protein